MFDSGIAVRMAVGARRGDVIWMMMQEVLTLVAMGAAVSSSEFQLSTL